MKLKYAVSLIALSVASTSALAASQSTGQGSSNAFMNQQLAAMTNSTGVTPTADWYNRIKVSGLLNLDVFAENNDKYLAEGTISNQGSQSAFNVSTLALNFDSQVNDWVSAHVGLFYATAAQPSGISGSDNSNVQTTRYYAAGESGGLNGNINGVDVDDAYVDIMNFNKAPVDLRVGRQYFGFGQYDRYAMMPTVTQQLTELRGTGAELNFVHASGMHADVFALRGMQRGKIEGGVYVPKDGHQIRNFGGMIGYTSVISKLGFDVSAGYLYNLADVGTIAQHYNTGDGYTSRTGAWDVNGSVMTGPFKLGIQYVAATAKMKDFTYNTSATDTKNPDPDAGNLYANYAFKTAGYNSKLTASYQWTNQALMTSGGARGTVATGSDFTLPESRVAAEYDVNVMKNTMVGLEVNFDSPYSTDHNGSGDNSLTGIARLSVLL